VSNVYPELLPDSKGLSTLATIVSGKGDKLTPFLATIVAVFDDKLSPVWTGLKTAEPAICRFQVRHPNHYSTKPHC